MTCGLKSHIIRQTEMIRIHSGLCPAQTFFVNILCHHIVFMAGHIHHVIQCILYVVFKFFRVCLDIESLRRGKTHEVKYIVTVRCYINLDRIVCQVIIFYIQLQA